MCGPRNAALLTPVLVAAWLSASLSAAEPELPQEVAKLFEIGWQPSLSAQAAAAEQFAKLDKMAPVDRRIPYAYALVQIRQRKYPEAARLVADVLDKEESNWHAWRTKIWLSMLMKDYPVALLEMDRLAQRVAAIDEGDSPGNVDNLKVGLASFLGRMFGFLEGPASGDVSDAMLADAERKLVACLTDRQREVFSESRRSVTKRFAELMAEGDRVQDQALVDAEAQKTQMEADLRLQEERIQEELTEIEPLRDKLESEYQAEMTELQDRVRPLLEQLARLEAQAAVVRSEALSLAAQIEQLEGQAAREKDPGRRQSLLREADRITFIYRRYESQLVGLDREYAGINAQRNRLVAEGQQAQARYQRDMSRVQENLAELGRGQKRIDTQRRTLDRPAKGNIPRARELARVANAFTTYEELPLDAERQRILASFK